MISKIVDDLLQEAVQRLRKNYNFRPSRQYELKKLEDHESDKRLQTPTHTNPPRTFKLPRHPVSGYTGIYDLKNKSDFINWFENKFPDLPDGRYTCITSKGGNNGMCRFFEVDVKNGKVVKDSWKKKSNGKEHGQSSSYHAFPYYFNLRDEWGV